MFDRSQSLLFYKLGKWPKLMRMVGRDYNWLYQKWPHNCHDAKEQLFKCFMQYHYYFFQVEAHALFHQTNIFYYFIQSKIIIPVWSSIKSNLHKYLDVTISWYWYLVWVDEVIKADEFLLFKGMHIWSCTIWPPKAQMELKIKYYSTWQNSNCRKCIQMDFWYNNSRNS